jgi:conjugal transfer pilin signal peptidase TrbI
MLRLAWALAKWIWTELRFLPIRAAVALGSGGLGQPPKPEQLLKAYLIVLPIGLATWWAIPQFTLVMSPSIHAWAVRTDPGPIHKGDLVSFMLTNPVAGPRPVSVTKYVLCMPGERLDMIEKPSFGGHTWDGWYFCDGKLLGVSKPYGRKGQKLDHYQPKGVIIPAGYAYVGSSHPDGFDSRYYGPVAIGQLTRMEKLL